MLIKHNISIYQFNKYLLEIQLKFKLKENINKEYIKTLEKNSSENFVVYYFKNLEK